MDIDCTIEVRLMSMIEDCFKSKLSYQLLFSFILFVFIIKHDRVPNTAVQRPEASL